MIAKISHRSDKKDHYNHCEDSSYYFENENIIRGGVFDGCSTGINSHFASQALCYAFANFNSNILSITDDVVLLQIHKRMYEVQQALRLTEMNLLSTAVIFEFYKHSNTLKLRVFGDAVYYVNGIEHVVDQGNKPDYMGYHFSEWSENFRLGYLTKYPVLEFYDVRSFAICSDGILSFKRSDFEQDEPKFPNPVEHMLQPPKGHTALELKMNQLMKDKYTLDDDLSIISYVQDPQRPTDQL